MEKKLSYLSIEPHLKTLQRTGVYPRRDLTSKLQKLIRHLYMCFSFSLTPIYMLQQTVKIYQVRDDINKVMETMFLLLTNSDAVYKHFIFWNKSDRIDLLIDTMKGPIFNQGVKEHEPILSQTLRFSRIFVRAFNGAAIFTCFLWIIYPVILFTQNRFTDFSIWLPFDGNKGPNFYAVIVYIWFQTSWLAVNNTTMDAFISFFLAQSKTQLAILRLDLENLVRKSKEEAKSSSKSYTKVLQKRLRKVLLHYNEIVKFTDILQETFGGAFLYQFLISGWIICITAYRTVTIDPLSVEFASMILYLGCIIVELFLFCHFGHEVNWESACVIESAYNMDWLELPINYRKDLVIFMERLKRPLKPMAGAFIPLSNNTFISIMRSSYSFYVLLKSTHTH